MRLTAGFAPKPVSAPRFTFHRWIRVELTLDGPPFRITAEELRERTIRSFMDGLDGNPQAPVFDGANLWVPNAAGRVDVVRATDGALLTSLTQPGMSYGLGAAFDGERVAVPDFHERVFVWRAADLAPLGSTALREEQDPNAICSDAVNFWITTGNAAGQLVRF